MSKAAANTNRSATQVKTGVGRASYVNVFTPRLNDLSGNEEYSMSFLIPKTDTATLTALRVAARAAVEAKWPDENRRPKNLRSPFRDGDVEKADDPSYVGHVWINVKSGDRPGVVDARVQPVIDPREFVSGDYCRISVNASAYDKKGNRGVSFWLNNIQVVRKGEPLGGVRRRAEDDFDALPNEDGAQPAGDEPW